VEKKKKSKAGKPQKMFPSVCLGQTWQFPALPGPLKAVVGKGLRRCSDFPFPGLLDIPNTFHPSKSYSDQSFLGGRRLLVPTWWWDRARCVEHAWRMQALCRGVCTAGEPLPHHRCHSTQKAPGRMAGIAGPDLPVLEPPASPRDFPSWHKGAELSWEP